LYWPSNQREQSYPVLLDWWSHQTEKNVPIWPGGDITKAGSAWPVEEIIRQIDLTRKLSQPGYTIWHLKAVANNADLRNRLTSGPYSEPALLPTSRTGRVAIPTLTSSKQSSGKPLIRWSVAPTERVAFWVLQTKQPTGWRTEILSSAAQSKELSTDTTDVALS